MTILVDKTLIVTDHLIHCSAKPICKNIHRQSISEITICFCHHRTSAIRCIKKLVNRLRPKFSIVRGKDTVDPGYEETRVVKGGTRDNRHPRVKICQYLTETLAKTVWRPLRNDVQTNRSFTKRGQELPIGHIRPNLQIRLVRQSTLVLPGQLGLILYAIQTKNQTLARSNF